MPLTLRTVLLPCFIMALCIACSDTKKEARILQVYTHANNLLLAGSGEKGRRYLDSCYKAEQFKGIYAQLRRNMFITSYYYEGKEPRKGTPFAFENKQLIENGRLQHRYPLEYAHALNALGTYYYFLNEDLDKAFDYYYKAEAVRTGTSDTCGHRNFKYLGLICYRQERYRPAIRYFLRALVSETACGAGNMYRFFGRQELMDNLALCYTRLHIYDTALNYYGQALDIISENEKRFPWTRWQQAKGVVYGNLAKALIALGKPDSAVHLLKASIGINSGPDGDRTDAQYSMMQLAELLFETHHSAPQQLLMAIRSAIDSLPNEEVSMRWNKLMYQISEREGRYREGNQFLRDYYRDSIGWFGRAGKIDLAQMLKYQSAQSKIALLQKENEIRKSYLWLAIGFSFFVVVIIILVFLSYRRSRKHLSQINEQNTRLETAKLALEQSNREKDRILNVVAHDLRNPVGLISFLSDTILQDKDTSMPPERMLTMIRNASGQSMTLINELLGVRDNPVLTAKEPVDMNVLAGECVDLLEFALKEKNQSITLSLSPDPVVVPAERQKLVRVFNNLLTNAIKFSKKGGLISLRVEKRPQSVLISVADQGIGIPEELGHHIFELFTSSRRSGTANEKSFGIGLSVCKQVVEAHGGTISFESKEGSGTTFYIELPVENY